MMKKYFSAILVALVTLTFGACSNDDIEISRDTTIRIVPNSVIAPFTYEVNRGELRSFNTAFKLRTRLLIYNQDGSLFTTATDFLANYESIMEKRLFLPNGIYTMVAVTDVVRYSQGSRVDEEYWEMSGSEKLNQLKLEFTGYDPSGSRFVVKNGILGYCCQQVTVSSNTSIVTLQPAPAGALLCVHYKGIHQLDGTIGIYGLLANRETGYITYNAQETNKFVAVPQNENDQLKWYQSLVSTGTVSLQNEFVSYVFMPPTNDVRFRFIYVAKNDNRAVATGTSMTKTIGAGEEYEILFDLEGITDISQARNSMTKVN